jgi:hypothetical protein
MNAQEANLCNTLLRSTFVVDGLLPPAHDDVRKAGVQLAKLSSKATSATGDDVVEPADIAEAELRGWKATTRTEPIAKAKQNGSKPKVAVAS